MFGRATAKQKAPKGLPATGELTPLTVPYKGLNARSPFAVMDGQYAISAINVTAEAFGMRSRKGYLEWANSIPGGTLIPVSTIMSYWPATAVANKIFAAKGNVIYNVTAGGTGPWVAELGVAGTSDYWTAINYQNIAGSFMTITNDNGGYSYYNGAAWATPTMGVGVGQIANVNPALFCHVAQWGKRLWFTEKNSTRAWYLPAENITGAATAFDFGSEFSKGGYLVMIVSWTIDGGNGMDDKLVAVGSNGDVVIYAGTDPATPDTFSKVGSFNCGPLPSGRRCASQDGGEVYILSQLGLVPLSKLLIATSISAEAQQHISYLVDPLITSFMKSYAYSAGWQLFSLPREELQLIGVPRASLTRNCEFLAYKVPTQAWSTVKDTTYAHMVTIGTTIYAGTTDGRVVKAYEGQLDNILIGQTTGNPIKCQVTPAYNPLGDKAGFQRRITMVRPSFLGAAAPVVSVKVLVDYSPAGALTVPSLPTIQDSQWNLGVWDTAKWGGLLAPIRKWLGCYGVGYAATPQIDYACAGDTLLTSIDFWTIPGGPL